MEPVQPKVAVTADSAAEAPKPVVELTQTDHVNKVALNSLKSLLDSNQFKFPAAVKSDDTAEDEWDASGTKNELDDEEYDPEKEEEQRKQAVAFFRDMMLNGKAEPSQPPQDAQP